MSAKKTKREIAKILINKDLETIEENELIEMILDESVAIDVDKESLKNRTFGNRMSDFITKFAGSWTFIVLFTLFITGWVLLNIYVIELDTFPFILLNLFLSCVAALQAPVIMMSQNREAERERNRNHNDYKTDLKSELILEALYDHVEEIHQNQKKILKFINENSEKLKEK